MKLKYYKLHNEVIDPHFATEGSSCFDICAYLDKPITVYDMQNKKQETNPENIQTQQIKGKREGQDKKQSEKMEIQREKSGFGLAFFSECSYASETLFFDKYMVLRDDS